MRTKYNMITNKFIKNGAKVLLASSLLFSSCDMDEKVYTFYETEDYFSSTSHLEWGVNGAYASLSSQSTYGNSWMVYDTDTDISHVKQAGVGHVARDLGHYNAYSSHPWLEATWAKYYAGVDKANVILTYKDDVVIKPTKADSAFYNNLIAQTKTIRAICYFDLVRLFGDIPKRTTPTKLTDPVRVPKDDRSLIYDLMITDLTEAIPDLPWVGETTQKGERLTKGAAMGILAKVYLFRGGYSLYGQGNTGTLKRPDNYKEYYEKSKIVLDELIASGKHGLLDSYERVFRNMCETVYNPYENMLEVAFFSPTAQVGTSSTMGTYNGPEISDKSPFGRANSFIKTHNFFFDIFDANDLRRDVSIATYSIDATNTVKPINKKTSYNWSPGKWRRNWHTGKVKDNNNTDVNVVMLRYADVLLMRAEVENELNGGPNNLAIEAMNQVRRRAYGKPYLTPDASDLSTTDFSGKDVFFKYLVDERARELCFEGHRRMDLIRWGLLEKAIVDTNEKFKLAIANKEMNAYTFEAGNRFKTGVHELYPIPEYDIRETGNTIIQNPGY